MKLVNKKSLLALSVLMLTVLFSCGKKDGASPGNSDEAAANRVVGTYKGTISPVAGSSTQYFNAIIIITKESGNKVKIAPKSGEAYSGFTTKIIPVHAITSTNDAESLDPQGVLAYQDQEKALSFLSKETAAGDVSYRFEGKKQ